MAKKQTKAVMADGILVYCAHEEIVSIEKVIPHPRNPNTHPGDQIQLLAKIIKAQGWRSPITVSTRSGFVIKGHGRYQAALSLGVESVPVDYQEYDNEAAEWADMIADNRIAELSQFDFSELTTMVREMDAEFLEFTGFTDVELQPMIDGFSGSSGESTGDDGEFNDCDIPDIEIGEKAIMDRVTLFIDSTVKRDVLKAIREAIDAFGEKVRVVL